MHFHHIIINLFFLVTSYVCLTQSDQYEWEGATAEQLGLLPADVASIKLENSKFSLQVYVLYGNSYVLCVVLKCWHDQQCSQTTIYLRRAALLKWKQYRNLIAAFERAGHQDFADTVHVI